MEIEDDYKDGVQLALRLHKDGETLRNACALAAMMCHERMTGEHLDKSKLYRYAKYGRVE